MAMAVAVGDDRIADPGLKNGRMMIARWRTEMAEKHETIDSLLLPCSFIFSHFSHRLITFHPVIICC